MNLGQWACKSALRWTPVVAGILGGAGVVAAYTCAVTVTTGDDIKVSGDITARARALASSENEATGWGYAKYEAKVTGQDVHGPRTTGAAALVPEEKVTVGWAPGSGDTPGLWHATYDFSFNPSGGGWTAVTGGSTISVDVTIAVTECYFKINGTDVLGLDEEDLPETTDFWLNNSNPYNADSEATATVEAEWGFTSSGAAPTLNARTTTSVYATWQGQNPDDTPPAPTSSHTSAVQQWAEVDVTVAPPTQ